MRGIVGCEWRQTVASALHLKGWQVMSCDLLPACGPLPHYRGDIMTLLERCEEMDLIVLHPECRKMAVSGNGTWAGTRGRQEAIDWTVALWEKAREKAPCVALENPGSVIFPVLRDIGADVQYIQPFEFGHPETKKTGLALHGLPRLKPTWDVSNIMATLPKKERHKVFYASPGDGRSMDRSVFFSGFASAMADQWTAHFKTSPNPQE